ncbi:unnamed protein product [Phytophthora fragariaefolia]|uniref:Unnamed protein product n=1 Tax=Phytophthora fragariaefolia TaxID=1490495 RepID=A0A9W6YMF0_9STRA|nr:unnamed protein product [Phytophthora fragariaefolia]
MSKMEAGTCTSVGAGNTPAPSVGSGRVRDPNAGVHCPVEAVCIVEATSEVVELPLVAAANCRTAADIDVSGVGALDVASSVLVAADNERDSRTPPDVVAALLGSEMAAAESLDAGGSALDVVGTLVELAILVDATSGLLMPLCAVLEVVMGPTGAPRAARASEEETGGCVVAALLSDMILGTARLNRECGRGPGCGVAEC